MAKITISDLSPSEEGKFINELTAWDMKIVYAAGWGRRSDRTQAVSTTEQQLTTASIPDTNAILTDWMDNLDVQIRELRTQLNIP